MKWSDIALDDVVVLACSHELPQTVTEWPVRVALAKDYSRQGNESCYLCGLSRDVNEVLARSKEPFLGIFVDSLDGTETVPREVVPSLAACSMASFSMKAWEDLVAAVCSRHLETIQKMIWKQSLKQPDKIAVIYEEREWSYREFVSAAVSLRDHLRSEGLHPDKGAVAVRMDASDYSALAYLALLCGRFVIHILDANAAGQASRLEQCPSQAVLRNAKEPASESDPASSLRTFFVDQIDLDRTRRVSADEIHGDLDDVMFIEYTSGSTGAPKSCETVQFRVAHWARWHQFHFPSRDHRDAYSLFWIWYWHIGLVNGSTVVVWPNWQNKDVSSMMRYFAEKKVTRCNCLTPGLISALLAVETDLPPSLKVMFSGGEGLPLPTCKQWLSRWSHVELISNYAITEGAADICFLRIDEKIANWKDKNFAPITQNIIAWNNRIEVENEALYIIGWSIANGYCPPSASDAFTLAADGRNNRYRTGDRVAWEDGYLFIQGRMDSVVKIRGFRIDLDGITALLSSCTHVTDVSVRAQSESIWVLAVTKNLALVQEFAKEKYANAHLIVWRAVDQLPITKSGKKDNRRISQLIEELAEAEEDSLQQEELSEAEERVAAAFKEVLGRSVGKNVGVFEAGVHSLQAMRIAKILGLPPAEIFKYPSIASLAQSLGGQSPASEAVLGRSLEAKQAGPFAVVGMAGRFPGADSVNALWEALQAGSLLTSAVPGAGPQDVQRKGIVPDLGFDCKFWKVSKEAASMMDTAQRSLLESAYEALADAGLDPFNVKGRVGVVVCGGSLSHYAIDDLGIDLEESRTRRADEYFALEVGTDKDYLATTISYRLNLQGPSEVVQTACSSGLVAIARAVQMLKLGLCDYCLCGGASWTPDGPVRVVDGLIWAPDGHCRPFAEGASGTTAADGGGLVLLTRLDAAQSRGERVYATVLGAATNNDGNRKAGFSAPSFQGQVEVLKMAHADAGISGSELDYVEAHGTGTKLGDPLEVDALTEVIGNSKPVLLGSVKGNIGHLNTAAGLPGFMKAALMLHHQEMVPTLHAATPSKQIAWEKTSLRLAASSEEWQGKLVGVSSFGVGGTNAHVVLGAAPHIAAVEIQRKEWQRDSLTAERKAWRAKAGGQKQQKTVASRGTAAWSKDEGLNALFYETIYERVDVSSMYLSEAALVWDSDDEPLPQGLPKETVLTNPDRALIAARAAGNALIFLGTGSREPTVDDVSQEELLFGTMSLLKNLAKSSRGDLEIFFILKASLRYSALTGLVRTALHEHPELRIRLLMLDGDGPVMLPALPGELLLRAGAAFSARLKRALPPAADPQPRCYGSALVTGGLRGLGLKLAEWLVTSGRAKSLVLVGRKLPVGDALAAIEELKTKVAVRICTCDVSSWESVESLPQDCDLVVHCAGNVKDGLLMNLDEEEALPVLQPKIRGAVHLKKHFPAAHRIAFSSSSGLFGVPGQSTYAAANTFLDHFMPSVQWGGWGEVGMAEDLGIKPVEGERFLTVARGMECFGRVLDASAADPSFGRPYCVLDVDWPRYRQIRTVFAPEEPLLAEVGMSPTTSSRLGSREVEGIDDGVQRWHLIVGPAGARFQGSERSWEVCQQHVYNGTAIFPGTGFVSLGLEVASQVSNSSQVTLLDVTFLKPLVLKSTRELTISLVRNGLGGTLRFASRDMDRGSALLHCTCSFASVSSTPAQSLLSRASSDSLLLPVTGLYARFADGGFLYGPAFQGTNFMANADVAACDLPEKDESEFAVHPGALDVAGQLGSLLHPLGCRGAPQSIARVSANLKKKVRKAQAHMPGDANLIDLEVTDADGQLAVKIEGMSFAAFDAPSPWKASRCTWTPLAPVKRGTWRSLGERAKQLGLSNCIEKEEEPHEAVVLAVHAKTLEDVKKIREEVRGACAKKKCWLLALEDKEAPLAMAAASAAIEVGAQAVVGSLAALKSVSDGLGVDAKSLIRAEEFDGKGQLLLCNLAPAEETWSSFASTSEAFVAEIDPNEATKGAKCRLCDRQTPGKGQVEIKASLWALNFRDVLVSVGAISTVVAGQALGIGGECYGEVTAVGDGVSNVAVGDHVMAVPPDGMGSFVTTDSRWVVKALPGMTPEEAVSGTAVYATAWQALHWMARIRSGDKVLVHSAAGGVGLAAIHLCKKAGCQVFATASTPEKRSYLLSLGVTAVFDSRNVSDFASGVYKATDGEGVDVVLNSLSGEAIPASLRLLRPMGRFIEIGKRDQYEHTPLDLNPFLKGLSYCAAHLDVLQLKHPKGCRKLLEEVWAEMPSLPCLPSKTYNMSELSDALSYFSQGIHIGKILVSTNTVPVLPKRPKAVNGPAGDEVTQALRLALRAKPGTGGVLCVPTLRDLVDLEELKMSTFVLTTSDAISSLCREVCPDTTCVKVPRWEVCSLDSWLHFGGQIFASEQEESGEVGVNLQAWLAEVLLEMTDEEVPMDESFEDAGLDSLSLISLARRLSSKVNRVVSVADLAEFSTPRKLLDSFSGRPQAELARPKAVCLHGFRSNSDAMAFQCGPLVSAIGSVDWIFVNSPRAGENSGAAPGILLNEAREWWGKVGGDYETGWMAPHFGGLEETLPMVERLNPVGAVGFSQGGGVAALLDCAWRALYSPVAGLGMKKTEGPCFLSYDTQEEYREMCREVGDYFPNKEVHLHSAGHDVPRDAESIRAFAAFVSSQLR